MHLVIITVVVIIVVVIFAVSVILIPIDLEISRQLLVASHLKLAIPGFVLVIPWTRTQRNAPKLVTLPESSRRACAILIEYIPSISE